MESGKTALRGAIIGDVVGSIYEFDNIKTKQFPLLDEKCFFTDDSVLTVAVAHAIMTAKDRGVAPDRKLMGVYLKLYGCAYPHRGYGGHFKMWLGKKDLASYDSLGNGAVMRCSAAGWSEDSVAGARRMGELTCLPTHENQESYKAASLLAELIYLARTGASMESLYDRACEVYSLPVLDDIRESYTFDVTCGGTMPVALSAFFESTDFEDSIRNAVSIGGDSDTIAAVTGALAEAYYGVPDDLWRSVARLLPESFLWIIDEFNSRFCK